MRKDPKFKIERIEYKIFLQKKIFGKWPKRFQIFLQIFIGYTFKVREICSSSWRKFILIELSAWKIIAQPRYIFEQSRVSVRCAHTMFDFNKQQVCLWDFISICKCKLHYLRKGFAAVRFSSASRFAGFWFFFFLLYISFSCPSFKTRDINY